MAFLQTTAASISSGGTINGDITIEGDLTVNGDGSGNYDEIVNGNIVISSGNSLGVGTDNPSTEVHVVSTGTAQVRIQSADASSDTRIEFYQSTTAKGFAGFNDSTDTMAMVYDTSMDSTKGININSSGNVLLGLSTADALLDAAITPALQVEGTTSSGSSLSVFRNDNGSSGPYLILGKSRGTSIGSDTVVQDNDQLGQIAFVGADGTDRVTPGARIFARVNGTPGSNDLPTELVFETTADGASATTERMTIDSSGNVGIGSTPTHGKVEIIGSSDAFQLVMSDVADSDDTTKEVRMGMLHYKQAEEPVTLFYAQSSSSTNSIYIGGGTGSGNHATSINLATASTYNSTSTTTNMVVDNNSRISLSNNDNGASNTIFGKNAGDSDGAGDQNVFVGELAGGTGTQTDAADGNTGVGYNSLTALTTGQQNTSVGSYNSDDITEGNYNTSVGRSSLASLTVGSHNTVMGRATFGVSVHDESYNVAIGNSALGSAKQDGTASSTNREVKKNVAIGYEALVGGTLTGTNHLEGCVAIGANAMDATGANNQIGTVAIGQSALGALTSAIGVTSVGYQSGKALTTGGYSTFLGYNAGLVHTTGGYNMAIGYGAMNDTDAGSNSLGSNENVFIGVDSGGGTWADTASSNNVAVGNYTMDAALDGAINNVAVGKNALGALTTGDGNVALGNNSMGTSTVGSNCVAIGAGAIDSATTSSNINGTVAVGSSALTALTSGAGNLAVGENALKAQTTGTYSLAIGTGVLQHSVDGAYNIGIGYGAMSDWDVGGGTSTTVDGSSHNTMIGVNAGGGAWVNEESNYNVGIGNYVMDAAMDAALYNTAVGYSALSAQTSGDYNTVLGAQAGLDSTTGAINTLIGFRAGYDIIGGAENTFIGSSAGLLTTAVVGATLIGRECGGGGVITTGANYTTAVGFQALYGLTSGAGNVAVGYQSQQANTSGSYNTTLGHQSMLVHDGGLRNVAIGAFAMDDTDAGSTSKASDDCVFIGYNSGGGTWANQDCSNIVAIGSNTLAGALAGDTVDGTIAIGKEALTALTTGAYNIAIGFNSMDEHTTGRANTCLGWGTMSQSGGDTTAQDNTFIGASSGSGDWAGAGVDQNTAVGYSTMTGAMTGSNHNSALGAHALEALTSGDENTALGAYAANDLTGGSSNVAVGYNAFATQANASAVGNIAVGVSALKDMNGAHTNNIAIGLAAIENASTATTFTNNIAIGAYAFDDSGSYDQTGTIAIGGNALTSLGAGVGSTAVGHQSGKNVTSGDYNTGYGYNTLGGNSSTALTGDRNTAIGASAGRDMEGASTGNTLVGDSSGIALTTGNYNTAVGYQAGDSITDGNSNVLVGRGTGVAMTSQDEMVLIGNDAGAAINNDAADGSIGIGYGALAAMTSGTHSTVIGASAGAALRGSLNTIIGHTAATALYTGTSNTVIGARAMGAADGGEQNNVIIGTDAGDVINDDAADGNVIIGHDADPSGSAGTNQIVIGQGATGVGNNSVTLGNASILNVYAGSDGGAHVHCSGVSFPATQDPSGGANVLDDYEEGDWTPVLSDGSNNATMSSSAAGRYTKIGPLVYLSAYVITTGLGSVSGAIRITGLPFTARNDGDANNGGSVGYAGGLEVAVNENVAIRVAPNTNYIQLSTWDVTGGTSAMQQDEWTANGEITMSLTYHAA